ncbi:MAG TPA: methionine aminotransferase [Candidatus Wallbacteria bacterium]|nr:MAG: Methionine aminotransferase [bacterium ADurb.Bin243]HOD39208.1 methionine aminotransferase [Candidatus Wallbacteria bacterium]HPG58302.1 methionine aminotransferase [Candidatus Wallbacteria bacterium]
MNKNYLTTKLQPFGTSVFAEMTKMAVDNNAINLSQGFPDFDGPEFIKEAACEAIKAGHNQYANTFGVPALRKAISEKYKKFYGLSYNPDTEISILAGATEAIFTTIISIINAGDEVIILEPYYDSYPVAVTMAGGICRYLTLEFPDFKVDFEKLEALVTKKTRMIIINTPHNPSGKVFTRSELEALAKIAIKHDLIVMSDEVYEHITFDGVKHIPTATIDGMFDRTITISSTGKTFSMTGWKIGTVCAPASMCAAVRTAHQYVIFAVATPFQHAMIKGFEAPDSFYRELIEFYTAKRDMMAKSLTQQGFDIVMPKGSYFIMADFTKFGFTNDVEFCKYLTSQIKVAAIPPTSFYFNKKYGEKLVRFAFCKKEETLAAAADRLKNLKAK